MPDTEDENKKRDEQDEQDSGEWTYRPKRNYETQVQRLEERRAKDRSQNAFQMMGAVIGSIVLLVVLFMLWTGFVGSMKSTIATPPPAYSYQPTMPTPVMTHTKLAFIPDHLVRLSVTLSGVAVAIGGLFFFYARSTRRKYIQFDKIGILISDSPRAGEGDARFIPWGCLYSIDVIYPKGKEETAADETMKELLRTASKDDPVVVFYVDDGSKVKVKWRDLVSGNEPGAFINALKTWSPDAIGACVFPGEDDFSKIDKNNYTQLWFKYFSAASDRRRTSQLEQGETLQDGRYTVAGRLGSGGQGTAYLAVDSSPAPGQPTEIVLKEYILPVHRGEKVLEQTIDKLRKEAEILRSIDHPNIVKMMGEFSEDYRGYLVMEYVTGQSLKALVAQEGRQPESLVLDIALQICSILEYLHGLHPPVVHRDLTPDNLILQDDGRVKLVDFNVAHQLESAATATVVGKHNYIPPEQFRGKPTIQSDIYAFGCTLAYMLTGEDPEPLSVSRPRTVNDSVSEGLDYVIATATALDAHKRFPSVTEMQQALLATDSGVKLKVSEKVVVSNSDS